MFLYNLIHVLLFLSIMYFASNAVCYVMIYAVCYVMIS